MKNLVILVADSLRYDAVPDRIREDATSQVIPTLAPSLHTPTSFASFFTGLEPPNHAVRDFMEDLDPNVRTAFDAFEHASFYDGPESAINKHIFQSDGKDLDAMEEPFIWIERVMESHLPYGEVRHDQDYEFEERGTAYVDRLRREGRLGEEYRNGVEKAGEHVQRHVDELAERGILDDTLVVLTSDHGELLGERFLWKRRYEHNYPPIRPLVEVPTVFYNAAVDADAMRLVDVIPTALGILGRDGSLGDGVDVRRSPVQEGRVVMDDVKARFDTRWRFDGDNWRPTPRSMLQIAAKTLIGDVKRFGYRKGYRPLEEKLERRTENELAGVEV